MASPVTCSALWQQYLLLFHCVGGKHCLLWAPSPAKHVFRSSAASDPSLLARCIFQAQSKAKRASRSIYHCVGNKTLSCRRCLLLSSCLGGTQTLISTHELPWLGKGHGSSLSEDELFTGLLPNACWRMNIEWHKQNVRGTGQTDNTKYRTGGRNKKKHNFHSRRYVSRRCVCVRWEAGNSV